MEETLVKELNEELSRKLSAILVVSSCTGTQRNETLMNCVTTPCMDMKTIGIPPFTGTPGQPRHFGGFDTTLTTMHWALQYANFIKGVENPFQDTRLITIISDSL